MIKQKINIMRSLQEGVMMQMSFVGIENSVMQFMPDDQCYHITFVSTADEL